jgi:hypothetical protein
MSEITQKTKIAKAKKLEEELATYERSVDMAREFISEVISPALDTFEYENDDEEYVSGTTTHGLFINMIQRLCEMGYTEKDLKREIKLYANTSIGEIVH